MVKINWNEHEVAILIYGYYLYELGRYSKRTLIMEISNKLRENSIDKKAKNNELFRNYNGISMKFGNIQYLFTNGKAGLKNCSNLEKDLFDLFVNKREKFDDILYEAKNLYHIFEDC